MDKIIKSTIIFRIFIYFRSKLFSDEKLKTQLLKRSHSLERIIDIGGNVEMLFFEVCILIDEFSRRNIKETEALKWAWELLYKVKFDTKKIKIKNIKSIQKDNIGIQKLIKERRSVRVWKRKVLDEERIKKCIDTAKWAPNSCNRQLWRFIILRKSEDKKFLSILTKQRFFIEAPLVIVVLMDVSEYGQDEKEYAYLDAGAVIQNLLLAFHSEGLGACWIGIKKGEKVQKNYNKFRERFQINKKLIPTSIIPVGYAKFISNAPPRRSFKELIIKYD